MILKLLIRLKLNTFNNILILLVSLPMLSFAGGDITRQDMQRIYEEVKTPYKYGLVIAPQDNSHKIDCPTVYKDNGKWYMTYVVYNGKDGLDGRGYETWMAESNDLLQWKTLGRVLSYRDGYWDSNQRGGFPSLIDWNWGGSYEMRKYKGRHWMTYIGGSGTGYEAVRAPLNIGIASTKGNISLAHEWDTDDTPLLSINDKDAQWWERLTQYKSTIYEDKAKKLGHRFVMFYNAGGVNPVNNMKAERIGIALSDDMKHWIRYTGNPVFSHEVPGIITGDAQIVKMGDKYVMFYFSAYNPNRKYNAFNTFAVSRDLVNWTDWNGADLVYPDKPYDEMFAHKSCVVKSDGVAYHFYCAVNNQGQRGIALTTGKPMGSSEVHFPQPEMKGKRIITLLNKGWRTWLTSASDSSAKINDTISVNLPHNWDDYYGYRQLRHGNLHGTAQYIKTFTIEKRPDKKYFLQIEGAGSYATVSLNLKTYARTPVGRTTMTLDVTDALVDGTNNIKILTEHPQMITDMPWVCGGCSSEWGFSEGSQPLGIFRPVSLVETDEVRVEPFGVHIWNNDKADTVYIDTEIKNYGDLPLTVNLVNKFAMANGKSVFRLSDTLMIAAGQTRVVRQWSKIEHPILWSTEAPYLYALTSMIKRDGNTTDQVETPYGIRTISWPVKRNDNDGRFYLNGKPIFINGTCEYEHLFGDSHAFSDRLIEARIKMIRNAGFNAFREAHHPHNIRYLQLADKDGLLFWSQFSAHIWYDTPQFRANFKSLLRQWIKERRNSPSVILWGLQNESVLPKDFAKECCDIIRQMDPTVGTMRAITTCNGGEGTDWNVVQNWSGTYGGDVNKYGDELKSKSQLLNGEYGAWRTLGYHKENTLSYKDYTEENFANLLETKVRLSESVKDCICGQFQWAFVSHDNPGRIQPDEALRKVDKSGPFNYKGLLTPWQQPVDAYYMYRANYVSADKEPMVYIVSHTWADRFCTGARCADISVYSNCDSVLLYNDAADSVSFGRKKRGGIGTHFVWENRMIRYNVLRAVGYHSGRAVAEDVIVLDRLERAPHFDKLYEPSLIMPTASDRNRDILKPADGYSYLYRINCGGDDYTDTYGNKWLQDTDKYSHSWAEQFIGDNKRVQNISPYQTSQSHISEPIHGTRDWPLFSNFRFGRQRLHYDFKVPENGKYRIELYFTEPWIGTGTGMLSDCSGLRLFDVAVNDSTVIHDMDVWAQSGHAGALKKVVYADIRDNKIKISFPDVESGEAVISAIAIAKYGKSYTYVNDNSVPKTFSWLAMDTDTIVKTSKQMLPPETDTRPSVVYNAVQKNDATEWTFSTGLAQEYAMRFRYKNLTGRAITAKMLLTDIKGSVVREDNITFQPTPDKFRTLSTTTGTFINAGKYKLTVKAKAITFDTLEVQ